MSAKRKQLSNMSNKTPLMPCKFCFKDTEDEVNFGKLKVLASNLRVHYYCVVSRKCPKVYTITFRDCQLLSSTITQSGKDDQGLEGFLLRDIRRELRNCEKIRCCYCNNINASLKCMRTGCNRYFHLPCGLENKTLHEFWGEYKSFCHEHRRKPRIPENIRKSFGKMKCVICFEEIGIFTDERDLLVPKCCNKTAFHLVCLKVSHENFASCLLSHFLEL